MNETLKIFSGRSNPILAKGIVDHLGLRLGDVTIRTFSDGELWVMFEETKYTFFFYRELFFGPGPKVLYFWAKIGPKSSLFEIASSLF